VTVSGFASTVTSASDASPNVADAAEHASEVAGRQQRRRSAAEEHRGCRAQRPARSEHIPRQRDLAQDLVGVRILTRTAQFGRRVGVEVAVPAAHATEGDVQIHAEIDPGSTAMSVGSAPSAGAGSPREEPNPSGGSGVQRRDRLEIPLEERGATTFTSGGRRRYARATGRSNARTTKRTSSLSSHSIANDSSPLTTEPPTVPSEKATRRGSSVAEMTRSSVGIHPFTRPCTRIVVPAAT
jgi:hypothetical protein